MRNIHTLAENLRVMDAILKILQDQLDEQRGQNDFIKKIVSVLNERFNFIYDDFLKTFGKEIINELHSDKMKNSLTMPGGAGGGGS